MHYNLLENSNCYVNTSVGNVDFDISDLVDIINLSGNVTISGSEDDVLCLEADLAARVKIEEVRYYFSSSTASGTVSPTIDFYYKNEDFESYSALSTSVGNGYYYTTISGQSAPRFIRLVHTVSGTAIDGTVNGFSALNDDEEIDFGTDGSQTSTSLTSSVYGDNNATITTVPVYNDSLQKRTAYVTVEPQGNSADELLSISTTSGGPWVGVRQDEYRIADKNENDWNYGTFENTETDGNDRLTLTLPSTSGTYTSKVFYSDEKKSFIDIYDEAVDSMVTKDPNKEVETLEIRSSNVRPDSYSIYRNVYIQNQGGYNPDLLKYRDFWRADGSLKYQSDELADFNYRVGYRDAILNFDQNTGRCAYSIVISTGYDDELFNIHIISNDGSFYDMPDKLGGIKMLVRNGECSGAGLYKLLQDTEGGIWFYFYIEFSGHDAPNSLLSSSGYHFIHLNSSFSLTADIVSATEILYDFDVVYDTRYAWYTSTGGSNQVVLLKHDGSVVATYTAAGEPRGVCSTSDGSCWFIDYDNDSEEADLVKLDSNGDLDSALSAVGGNNLIKVAYESDSALWVIDGDYVKRIFTSDGSLDFSTFVANAESLTITDTGVWVATSDNYYKFIDKNTKLIDGSFSHSYTAGVLDLSYDTDIAYYASRIPTEVDTSVWKDLEWKEVRSDKYELSYNNERYHQLRVTLRAALDGITPEDYFEQEDGSAPKSFRWSASDGADAIFVNDGKLRLLGDGAGGKSITSEDKWHIASDSKVDIDIQVEYSVVGDFESGPKLAINYGEEGTYDTEEVKNPSVIKDGTTYKAWYQGKDASGDNRILYATSSSGINWTNHQMVVDIGDEGTYDTSGLGSPFVIKDGSTYKMWYNGSDGSYNRIIYAESSNGTTWSGNQMVVNRNSEGVWDGQGSGHCCVVKDAPLYKMWYSGYDGSEWRIIYCDSSDGINWSHFERTSIDASDTYDQDHAYAPSVIKEDSTYKMWYRGIDQYGYGRILQRTSSDGVNWSSYSLIFDYKTEGTYDANDIGSPSVIKDNSSYFMLCDGSDSGNTERILYAKSNDDGVWPDRAILYIRLYELPYTGHYAEARATRYTGGGLEELRIRIYDGSSHRSYSDYTVTSDQGKLRLRRRVSDDNFYAYDYINSSWESQSQGDDYGISNTDLYLWIYTNNSLSTIDIDSVTFYSDRGLDYAVFYDEVNESPIVHGLYMQKSIELPDIYPGNSKDVYVRSLVPTQDLGYVGSYNSNLKAWWEVPTNV